MGLGRDSSQERDGTITSAWPMRGLDRAKSWSLIGVTVCAFCLVGFFANLANSQDGEDELGNWLIYNGTFRFSERWSLFTEGQLRLWEVVSNPNEVLLRATPHYDVSPDAMVGLGYVYSHSWPFVDSTTDDAERTENRIYQQFAIRHKVDRSGFEHRYRLEQRWLEQGGSTDFSSRFRYRLQVTTPLNRETMQAGATFINAYNEVFINLGHTRSFDQNRLYAAGGYQFTALANLQLGLLWQARTATDFFRLQIFYTHNFDWKG